MPSRILITFIIFLIFCMKGISGIAQVLFYDDFSDGDFTIDSTWTGTPSKFRIDSERKLQLFDTAAGTAILAVKLPPELRAGEFRFFVKMAFSPSGNNFARIWLKAAADSLAGLPDGYFLQLGEGGSNDAPELYKVNSGITTRLIRGTEGLVASSFELDFKFTLDDTGLWKMYAGAPGGTLLLQGSAKDTLPLPPGTHWGVYARYTLSNRDKFHFDNFQINTYTPDTIAPQAVAAEKIGTQSVAIRFNEAVDATSVSTEHFWSPELGFPSQAFLVPGDASLVQLYYTQEFVPGKIYFLSIKGLSDMEGNIGNETNTLFYGRARLPRFNELLITEIFADELPQVRLPEAEFLEIHNRTDELLHTEGVSLSDNTSTTTLPTIELMPGEYVILCTGSRANQFVSYGRTVAVSGFPSLNNTGERLTLRHPDGSTLFSVNYSNQWIQDRVKREGGWSLEMIDTDNPCAGQNNWGSSIDPNGGTPGKKNSIAGSNPDQSGPQITLVDYTKDTLYVIFNETINVKASSRLKAELFGKPVISAGWLMQEEVNTLQMTFDSPLKFQEKYALTISNHFDCAGNPGLDADYKFIVPEKPTAGDLIINEVLFNPPTGAQDFVEILNATGKHLNIKGLTLENGSGSQTVVIPENYLLPPYGYLALTQDKNALLNHYPAAGKHPILQTPPLPSYNNGDGHVKIRLATGELSDEFEYNEKMHHPLIRDVKGVSLERIKTHVPASDYNNWHSAAESVGFATPGYLNSQSVTGKNTVKVAPPIFSPDGDGYNDFALINYQFDQPGTSGRVEIYDAAGRLIKTLFSDTQLAGEGFIRWDGTDDELRAVPYGNYIIIFSIFNLNAGNTQTHKLKVSVGGRIN